MADRVTGARSPGLAAILAAPGGPTYRQLEHYVRRGYLKPDVKPLGGERDPWSWSPAEARVAIDMGRLVNAGLRPAVAIQVARHRSGGPVVLAPGIIISVFPQPTSATAEEVA